MLSERLSEVARAQRAQASAAVAHATQQDAPVEDDNYDEEEDDDVVELDEEDSDGDMHAQLDFQTWRALKRLETCEVDANGCPIRRRHSRAHKSARSELAGR